MQNRAQYVQNIVTTCNFICTIHYCKFYVFSRQEEENANDTSEPEPFSGNPLYVQTVTIEAIPDAPMSSFLLRRSRTPSPIREKRYDSVIYLIVMLNAIMEKSCNYITM